MRSSANEDVFRERFWEKVQFLGAREGDCWNWIGKINNYGYGMCFRNGKEYSAHRVAYEMLIGKIPDGMTVDHLCRNRRCVNPFHVEIVTNVENVLRGESPWAQRKRQTHCIRGHPLSGENLRIRKNGTRFCIECGKQRAENRRKEHGTRSSLVR